MGRFVDDLNADLRDLKALAAAWLTPGRAGARCFFCHTANRKTVAYRYHKRRIAVCPKCAVYAERRFLARVR